MDYFHSRRYLDTLPDWESGRPSPGPLELYLPRMRALLALVGDPQRAFPSVIVGGTNGKGTVSSLLASLLQASGRRCGLYTSPHLHTVRERVQVEGECVSKEAFAAAVTDLDDATRQFPRDSLGAFTRFEALTALGAMLFARAGVDWGVFEVGLGGRWDATNAWDSTAAILTSVDVDHVAQLGPDPVGIAADKLHIARPGRPLFTTARQRPEVMARIRQEATARSLQLFVAGAEDIETPDGRRQPYCCRVDGEGRPATYLENAQVALAAAAWLQPDLRAATAAATTRQHRWPGRFERAHQEPPIVLDGAHNPAAAERLASELRALAPGWTLVLGVGQGHDPAGILAALRPVAARVVLTSSGHPKALAPEALAAAAPDGMPVEVTQDCRAAFARTLMDPPQDGGVCVAGSLYLVARAREFLDLPMQRDGITEDVALESLACLREACGRLGLGWQELSADGNVVCVTRGGRRLHFLRNKNPFNDYVTGRLAEDKGYQYELFGRAGVPQPETLPVFNPLADARFDRYRTHASVDAVIREAEQRFRYPLVVKKCHSSLAQGVYLAEDAAALRRRLEELFGNSGFLDNVVLLQEFVDGPEYRIVASGTQLLLAYAKVSDSGGHEADLNPLHQSDGRAVRIEDAVLLTRLEGLTRKVAAVLDLGLYAIDLIDGPAGLRVLEINPNPFCFFYNRTNGREDFVRIYAALLDRYLPPA